MTAENSGRLPFTVGAALSNFGDSVLTIVFMIWVTSVSGKPALGATASWLILAPVLLAPFWGVYADRRPARAGLFITCALTAGILLTAVVFVPEAPTAATLLACCGAYGLAAASIDPTVSGAIPRMVGQSERDLASINAIVQGLNQGFRIGAPFIGTAIYGLFGGRTAMAVAATALLLAAVAFTRPPYTGLPPVTAANSYLNQLRHGAHTIRAVPDLRRTVITGATVMGCIGALEAVGIGYIYDDLALPAEWLGAVLGIQGVGLVIGLTLAGKLVGRMPRTKLMSHGVLLVAASLLLCLPRNIALAAPVPLLAGTGFGMFLLAYSVGLQASAPAEAVSTVAGFASSVVMAFQIASLTAAIALLPITGSLPILLAVAVLLLVQGTVVRATSQRPHVADDSRGVA